MIASVWIAAEEDGTNPDQGNTDVLLTLRDGRKYAFTAFTPSEVARFMQQEGSGHFFCDDLLLVRDLKESTIRAALEELAAHYDLDRHGLRQTKD